VPDRQRRLFKLCNMHRITRYAVREKENLVTNGGAPLLLTRPSQGWRVRSAWLDPQDHCDHRIRSSLGKHHTLPSRRRSRRPWGRSRQQRVWLGIATQDSEHCRNHKSYGVFSVVKLKLQEKSVAPAVLRVSNQPSDTRFNRSYVEHRIGLSGQFSPWTSAGFCASWSRRASAGSGRK